MFIVGHLGNGSGRKIFPIRPADGENPCKLNEITQGVADAQRIYDGGGLARTLKGESGGQGGKTGLYAVKVLKPYGSTGGVCGLKIAENKTGIASTCIACDYKDISRHNGNAVAILRKERNEYGKSIRKDYEAGKVAESRHNMTQYACREDGISNTLSTVQKDNLLMCAYDEQNNTLRTDGTVGTLTTDSNSPKVIGGVGEKTFGKQYPQGNRIYDIGHVSPALQANNGNASKGSIIIGGQNIRIRRLTPKECWRLQGFPDEYFDKAKYKKEKIYFVGGEDICCAKLMAATEKPKLFDTETCVLCTTKDMLDMEMSTMMENPSKNEHCNEQILNVNIAMIKSENMAHLECAANIIKCIDFMGMRCTMIKSQEAQTRTDIIVSVREQKGNTEKYMRITTMCNLPLNKLYTILTLLKLIIELKIFTSTTLEANMQGFMRYTTDLEGNILLKVSNLEMEHIMQRTSDSALYKMAGNAVSVPVAKAIGLRLMEIEK